MALTNDAATCGEAPGRSSMPLWSVSWIMPQVPGDLHLDQQDEVFQHGFDRRVDGDVLQNPRLAVAQDVGAPALGNVARDADQADDLVLVVAQRNLRRQDPRLLAAVVDDVLLLVDHRPAGLDDPLLVGEETGGEFAIDQLQVGLADDFLGRPPHAPRRRPVADDEPALDVLDPEVVGHPIDQRLQRDALVGDRAAGLGDVLVRRNPAAARQGVVADLDAAAVGQFGGPGVGRLAGVDGFAKLNVRVDLLRRRAGRDAQLDDLAQAHAGAHVGRVQAIDLGIAGVGQDQPLVVAEEADAFGNVLDGQRVAVDLGTQRRDRPRSVRRRWSPEPRQRCARAQSRWPDRHLDRSSARCFRRSPDGDPWHSCQSRPTLVPARSH